MWSDSDEEDAWLEVHSRSSDNSYDSMELYEFDEDSPFFGFDLELMRAFASEIERIRRNIKPAKTKNVLCKFFVMGGCKKGESCRFSHEISNTTSETTSPSNVSTRKGWHPDGPGAFPCKFFAQGSCFKGDMCNFSHSKSEEPVPTMSVKTDDDNTCAICFEDVVQNGRKFGILVGCDHVFCLECIRGWRRKGEKQTSSGTAAARSCPLCRQPSHYIIPSPLFVKDEEKAKLDSMYKEALQAIPCKYFTEYATCPFKDKCFYAHKS